MAFVIGCKTRKESMAESMTRIEIGEAAKAELSCLGELDGQGRREKYARVDHVFSSTFIASKSCALLSLSYAQMKRALDEHFEGIVESRKGRFVGDDPTKIQVFSKLVDESIEAVRMGLGWDDIESVLVEDLLDF